MRTVGSFIMAAVPDTRTQRGAHPRDRQCFSPTALPTLRTAVGDLCWLLGRGYPPEGALELVGNRDALRDRQRKALQRCAASAAAVSRRSAHRVPLAAMRGEDLLIDGYNVLLTVEAALSGGVVLRACDGTMRDLAAMNRHYRSVETTVPALLAIGTTLSDSGCRSARWLLDQPIKNSGRLQGRIERVAEEHHLPWRVELVPNPDPLLRDAETVIATADSAVLDRCARWLNLTGHTIERFAPAAWVVDLAG